MKRTSILAALFMSGCLIGCGNSPWGLYLAALAVHTHEGIQGEKGESGMDGVDGQDGQNAIDGTDGVDGKDGIDGEHIVVDEGVGGCTKVSVCHKGRTIEVCEEALAAHLENHEDDYAGICDE